MQEITESPIYDPDNFKVIKKYRMTYEEQTANMPTMEKNKGLIDKDVE